MTGPILTTLLNTNRHFMVTKSKAQTRTPNVLNSIVAAPDYTQQPPKLAKLAITLPHWHRAMRYEYQALMKANTWTVVPPPHNAEIIGSKWVFTIKKHLHGTIQKYKARFVAQSFYQEEG
ncbi:uncharacterized mitochondrial protein AtMg00820-like [Arachis stenosperma]|uniref:uncharacterized mitochondrial protein AtMg00820-like n=1 Tax=Arachis stenosperma TaxID=217475 RepID=UPI0025AD2EAF|nr:uncharacterized mitochondrial protein AtMg00820-like [Arachis stenosperma]